MGSRFGVTIAFHVNNGNLAVIDFRLLGTTSDHCIAILASMPLDYLNSLFSSSIPLRVFNIWDAFLRIQVQIRSHTVWKAETAIALERVSERERLIDKSIY